MARKPEQIIIKKIKKVSGHGHHGGAWKIAYADFVTAMMAFFLLMWLLNATSEEQKRGIANYFDPFASKSTGGGNMGVMGGTSVKETEGSLDDRSNRIALRPTPLTEKGPGGQGAGVSKTPDPASTDNGGMTADDQEKIQAKKDIQNKLMKQKEAEKKRQESPYKSKDEEEKAFHGVSDNLKKAIEEMPELRNLSDNLKVEMTPEGLRISIVDQIKTVMFPNGSSRMYKQMEDLLHIVGIAIKDVPNKVAMAGHTDGTQYTANALFSNWELSTERANASRRVLVQSGVQDDRFESVVGRADRELYDAKNPQNPQNRRVSITLLRQVKV